jgi:hypothetical protein
LIEEAVRLLRAIFRSGFRYKAGIMLTELVPAATQPARLSRGATRPDRPHHGSTRCGQRPLRPTVQ